MIRKLSILIVASFLSLFAWLNWNALSAITPISLGWMTVQAPLGLVVLIPVLVLCVLFSVWAVSLQARVLRDVRMNTQALQQRELADREEIVPPGGPADRLPESAGSGRQHDRGQIGELEDRMERANLLPRTDSV